MLVRIARVKANKLAELEASGAPPNVVAAALPRGLHDDVDLVGDAGAIRDRIGAHAAAGAHEIVVIPVALADSDLIGGAP